MTNRIIKSFSAIAASIVIVLLFGINIVENAKKNMEEYKKAFLETGSTKEEWEAREMDIYVGYDIKYQNESIVSFVLTGYEGWASYSEKIFIII